MNDLLRGRKFQLWEYKASHGSLLIRSPKHGDIQQNIDIKFFGVIYLAIPRHLNEIHIAEPNKDELEFLETKIGKKELQKKIYIIVSGEHRYSIVSEAYKIDSNELDIFDSPFD
jgi:hypothetical protein